MNKTRSIVLHACVWIAIILLLLFISSKNTDVTTKSIVIYVYFGAINIAVFYSNYLYLFPKYLIQERYWRYGVTVILLILVSALIKYGMATLFKDIILIRGDNKEYHLTFYEYYLAAIFTSTFFVFLSSGFKFCIDWFINERVRKNLQSEKLTAELAFLKSQINPHFLLNSLNNIYSLAYKQSPKTPEAVLKLSEMMRYMLYESNDKQVELAKELRYLENYIELQKLRFKDQVYINFSVSGDYSGQTIAPLILIPFVENAFKHGLATDAGNPITISITTAEKKLSFRLRNKKSKLNKDETGGIGLQNVIRRLDLLYPRQYHLQVDDTEQVYQCELQLDL